MHIYYWVMVCVMKKKQLIQLKKSAVIGIFLLSFPCHFFYSYFPNILMSFFFPVNESIFEHLKILFTSILLYGIIDHFLLLKMKISYHNFSLQLFLTGIFSIVVFLILYLPCYYLIGEFFPFTILLMLVTYSLSQVLSYYILSLEEIPYFQFLSILFIILVYLNFLIFTYFPCKYDLFLDPTTNRYGIQREKN